jgi:hypothetical protein
MSSGPSTLHRKWPPEFDPAARWFDATIFRSGVLRPANLQPDYRQVVEKLEPENVGLFNRQRANTTNQQKLGG